ncbi:serine hydrolase domain-containing protein [Flavobacterium silvaticum]|uniref:Serine hydrolase n=1 Tax=Flavobacterium silvaticum TaxID=1852020 RepID=A0A972FQR7_9FLAO|nr:serine hydrolase domain-containing protein [Flavobacterium silvaticum]NMH26753.1 serine hydrolase [Flavobacterium silvaticum]
MKKTLLILSTCLFILNASAQTIDKTRLDSYFDALEQHNKFMGSVAISKGGSVIYTKSIGFADVENNIRATEKSKYHIGSISKTFTAALILKAVESKLLSLDQNIGGYFPEVPNSGKITIYQLLHHRSGIYNITDDPEFMSWAIHPQTEQQLIAQIAKKESVFEPGTTADYSNSNYILLSIILEKIYGKPYAELLSKDITQPLGLKHTYSGKKINVAAGDCKSYGFDKSWKQEIETDPSVPLGAGAIVSTPTDLSVFIEALFKGKIISAKSLDMMKDIKDDYGMALFSLPFGDKKGFGHTGSIDGFSSVFCHIDEQDVSVVLLSNGNNFNMNDILIVALNAVYSQPFSIPDFKSVALTPEQLDTYTGVYSTTQMPMKITIAKEGSKLTAQATGQSAFPLEAFEKDKFRFDAAGILIEFDTTKKTLTLKQGGGEFLFTKE